MTFKLQAQAGSRRRSCGVTPRTISGMPSSTERDEWGACTSFGRVLKAADITSVRPGSARCGIAQPNQNNPEVRSEHPDDVGAPCRWHSAGAGYKGAASLTKAPSAFRKIGEAVNRQGALTITGSNVRLGTEMPVALSYFL